ncbi:hypothetical protein [Mucilaginibacter paludis]|uniref:Uncharacterized protein n=1 Tax=Mucilaginibacter paludis DSM 18603 TaxID=714943 RepID=H1XZ90_9SPHI|nr:hypothetical protein [Mucilaginibacter paludis]EHQ24675.1 hypothetical protein Mucpa_0481 [Mucilaginibacter paludis DSM 18603]
MVLQHFTWQQFLVAATILTAIWYAVIILIFYRHRIQDLLHGKQRDNEPPEPLGHAWDEDFEEEPEESEADDLIGKSALPEGMSKVSMSMFGFAPDVEETAVATETFIEREKEEDFKSDVTDEERERQQSNVPDVLEELKNIYHILETEQGTKADFISLFSLVSSKYRGIRGTASQRAINDHIRENLPFDITEEELDGLWP